MATKIATWIFIALATVIAAVHSAAVLAGGATPKAEDILGRAAQYQREFRAGDMAVVPDYVAMLEAATRAEPENADLWYAMGRAYLLQGARAMLPGGNPADAMPAMQKGPAALKRALQINPDHPLALAQLGGVQALMASMLNQPALATQGVADMNRAAQLAPDSTMVRLTRAFLGLSLPDSLRNHASEFADLDFLIEGAEWGAAADYVRILRGDLFFETGQPAQARADYRSVAGAGSAATSTANKRLLALDQGGVAMADIKALRTAAGAQCAMCHGR
jgi:hypothetical protein